MSKMDSTDDPMIRDVAPGEAPGRRPARAADQGSEVARTPLTGERGFLFGSVSGGSMRQASWLPTSSVPRVATGGVGGIWCAAPGGPVPTAAPGHAAGPGCRPARLPRVATRRGRYLRQASGPPPSSVPRAATGGAGDLVRVARRASASGGAPGCRPARCLGRPPAGSGGSGVGRLAGRYLRGGCMLLAPGRRPARCSGWPPAVAGSCCWPSCRPARCSGWLPAGRVIWCGRLAGQSQRRGLGPRPARCSEWPPAAPDHAAGPGPPPSSLPRVATGGAGGSGARHPAGPVPAAGPSCRPARCPRRTPSMSR
ncbi:hypothetical protein D3C85_365780 [compost metagenome]